MGPTAPADPYATVQNQGVDQHPDGGGTAVIAAPPDVNEPFIPPSETLGPEPQSGGIDKVSMVLSVVGLLIVIGMVVVVFLMNVE